MHRYIAFAGLLFMPACLNPDISEEYPSTMQAEAMVGDAGAAIEDSTDDEDRADDAAPAADEAADDVADRDAEDVDRPRRNNTRR
jgi:hypothetical protein